MMMNDLKSKKEGNSQPGAECAENDPDSATNISPWMVLVSAIGMRLLLGSTVGTSGVMLVEFSHRLSDTSLPLLNAISSMQYGVSTFSGKCMV
jgi:hypothetical protein